MICLLLNFNAFIDVLSNIRFFAIGKQRRSMPDIHGRYITVHPQSRLLSAHVAVVLKVCCLLNSFLPDDHVSLSNHDCQSRQRALRQRRQDSRSQSQCLSDQSHMGLGPLVDLSLLFLLLLHVLDLLAEFLILGSQLFELPVDLLSALISRPAAIIIFRRALGRCKYAIF